MSVDVPCAALSFEAVMRPMLPGGSRPTAPPARRRLRPTWEGGPGRPTTRLFRVHVGMVTNPLHPREKGPRSGGSLAQPDRNVGIMSNVATASAVPSSAVANPAHHGPATRPNMVAVGTIVWLSSELMFFAGLFAVYFQLRSVRGDLWATHTEKLNLPFASVNCLVLVISSVWCQLGVWKAERGQKARTGRLFDLKSWGMREWY